VGGFVDWVFQTGVAGGYCGHYVVVTGYDEQLQRYSVTDPAQSSAILLVSSDDFDAARLSHGTDEDLLVIPWEQPSLPRAIFVTEAVEAEAEAADVETGVAEAEAADVATGSGEIEGAAEATADQRDASAASEASDDSFASTAIEESGSARLDGAVARASPPWRPNGNGGPAAAAG